MTLDSIKKLFAFSWSQAFSDQNGKSSIVPVSGFIIICTGCIGFLKGISLHESDTVIQAVVLVGIGSGLLGYHKHIDGAPQDLGVTEGDVSTITKTSTATSSIKLEQS